MMPYLVVHKKDFNTSIFIYLGVSETNVFDRFIVEHEEDIDSGYDEISVTSLNDTIYTKKPIYTFERHS